MYIHLTNHFSCLVLQWKMAELNLFYGTKPPFIVGWVMMFNTTFNNISVISWRSVLLLTETGVLGENLRPVTSHWQTWSHNIFLFARQMLSWCTVLILCQIRWSKSSFRYSRNNNQLFELHTVWWQCLLPSDVLKWYYRLLFNKVLISSEKLFER
jgi:hypothetical protein